MSGASSVTVDQFLAFAVPLERRKIQQAQGDARPFPALPPCPVCAQPVISVVERSRLNKHYSIGLGCHRLLTVTASEEFDFSESLLAKARKIAASLEGA